MNCNVRIRFITLELDIRVTQSFSVLFATLSKKIAKKCYIILTQCKTNGFHLERYYTILMMSQTRAQLLLKDPKDVRIIDNVNNWGKLPEI